MSGVLLSPDILYVKCAFQVMPSRRISHRRAFPGLWPALLHPGNPGGSGTHLYRPAAPFTIRFFTDADLNSGNVIMTALLSDIGLTPGTQFDFSVFSWLFKHKT
jgi:hypothetical protein